MALDLIAELESLLDRLDRAGIAYALCGGLALAVHGHPRATMDIDILITRDQLDATLAVGRQAGFDLPAHVRVFGRSTDARREIHRLSKLDPETTALMSFDLIVVGPGLEAVWSDRLVVAWRERAISIVSRAGLATMKRLAGRPQDLADLAVLEGTADDDDQP